LAFRDFETLYLRGKVGPEGGEVRTEERRKQKESLALDVEVLRARLGPVKVALIEQWIREVNGPFDALIAGVTGADSLVLDAGCSRGDPDLPAMNRGRALIGADVDLPGLRANFLADGVVCAPLDRLPFPDGAFDVVVSKWVAEHLEHPERDFAEAARVLRPGGALVLLTPNAHSIFTFISRAIPYRLKQIIKGRLFQGHEEDTFRTWYRANTVAALARQLDAAGFREQETVLLPGMWTFFIFSRPLARLVRWLELRQSGVPGLRRATTYIAGVWIRR